MIRTLPVNGEALGLVSAGTPEPVMVWEDIAGRRTLTDRQETDKDTGQRLWTVYVMPTLAERPEVLQVRVTADHQPVLAMFGPVKLEGLAVNVRKDKSGNLVGYWNATAAVDASHGGRKNGHQEHKAEGQAA